MPTCYVDYENNPNGIFYAGQQLKGIVKIDNDKKRSISGITLRIEGYAKVSVSWIKIIHKFFLIVL